MPKKTASARGGAQRNKPRVQKSIELVRPTPSHVAAEQEVEVESVSDIELTDAAVDTSAEVSTVSTEEAEKTAISSTLVAPEVKKSKNTSTIVAPTVRKRENSGTKFLPETDAVESASTSASTSTGVTTSTAPKGSAAAKVAARRQVAQKAQQRAAATLITAEHYAYVRRDLVFIGILAAIMFATIIILHFVPGIGS
jgi:hypothetical protein